MDENQGANWQYKSGTGPAVAEKPKPAAKGSVASHEPPKAGSVSWAASEYIEHQRDSKWYLILGVSTLLLTVVVFLFTKDYFASVTILVLGFIVAAFAHKKPRQLSYELNESGLKIGEKNYSYRMFKSFSVIHEGGLVSINLMPLKRFQPPITIYFAAQDEEQITSALGGHLPYEDRPLDRIDRITKTLRF